MLILTGPQGAGNHLWSKIFSLHPDVYGWKTLLDNYWEAHRFAEPFCQYWRDHSLLKSFNWSQSDYYFTSISCPLGIQENKWMPDVLGFADTVIALGHQVQIAVCGRDQTILKNQQTRVRHEHTFPMFLEQLSKFKNPAFLSYELLHLYQSQYLNSLDLIIPVACNNSAISEILHSDSNKKYIHYVNEYALDQCNKTGLPLKFRP
jgi:hypothetical protein